MKRSGSVSGAVSLVMIFCILCLAIFSVLTLATADRESRLSERTAQNTAEYYQADYNATVIAAALGNGSALPADIDAEIAWEGDTAYLRLPVGETLELNAALSVRGGACEILWWRTLYVGSWEPDDYLNLWDGD